MFFEPEEIIQRKSVALRQLPPVPDTGWRAPSEFPNLSGAVAIGLDLEAKELDWSHGPGWSRDKSSIVGFSIAARGSRGESGKWYFPVRHEIEPSTNLDPANCFGWLREALSTNVPKVGANLMYDLGTLAACENITAAGELIDVTFAQALLDEESPTALEYLGQCWLGEGKQTNALYEWSRQAYGGGDDQRGNIWRTPPRLAGPYAEQDAELPLRVYERQYPELVSQGLLSLFRMECRSIRLLIRMRLAGVTIDLRRARELSARFVREIETNETALHELTGLRVNVASPQDMAQLFGRLGVELPKHARTGKTTFEKGTLSRLLRAENASPEIKAALEHVLTIREYAKLKSTFIDAYLLNAYQPISGEPDYGLIHCTYHPLKSDDGGARTGRFASSDPNLQNIPARTKEGKAIRSAFVHDRGHAKWRKFDYSQIEYRMLAHFAGGIEQREIDAANALRQSYIDNPKTDYHDRVYSQVAPIKGWEYPDPDRARYDMRRKPIKNVNFGIMYGQSENALAYTAGFSPQEAREFFAAYHAGAPYVRSTMNMITREVNINGHVTTIAGRRCRLNWYENALEKFSRPLRLEDALREYGPHLRVWKAYRGTNYKLQGSAADVIKYAMVQAYDAGIFDVTGVPKLQVHDELDFSVMDESKEQNEAYAALVNILENSTPCRVPIIADRSEGINWAEAA